MRGILRGVREEIFESNLPGLWILIVQKLEELDLFVRVGENRMNEWNRTDLSQLILHDVRTSEKV